MTIQQLARPEILALEPYVSARMQADVAAVALDANECPWSLFGDPQWSLNRYPDPQPKALLSALATRYGVEEKQLLVTRGSDEGIDLLLRAFRAPVFVRCHWSVGNLNWIPRRSFRQRRVFVWCFCALQTTPLVAAYPTRLFWNYASS